MSQRLFISHSARDKRYADPLHSFLMRLGYRVGRILRRAPASIGASRSTTPSAAATRCWSCSPPNSAESIYVTYEWALALALNIRVIPITFVPARFHPRLEHLERFDVTSFRDQSHFWDYFAREMRRMFPYQPPAPAPMPPSSFSPAPAAAPAPLPPHRPQPHAAY